MSQQPAPRRLPLRYNFDDGPRRIRQRAIELQVRFGQTPLPGDSGCPVLVPHDDDLRRSSGRMPPQPWGLPTRV